MYIFIILFISAVLRFYNLPENFVFAGDEEHQTLLAMSLVKDFHIIWIGVNAAHLGFYLGPYWTYFTYLWLWLSGGNPLITGYIAASIGVTTTFLVILTGSKLFNQRIGLLAGLLYATLPLIVFFDQRYWNPSLLPLLAVLMFLSLGKLKGNPKWLLIFAGAFGLVFHVHLSLVPVIFVAVFWVIWQKIILPKKILLLSFLLFILMVAPLVAFDYFHRGSNITTPLRLREISSEPVNRVNPLHHLQALFQTMGRIWYLKPGSINSDEIIAPCAVSSRTDTTTELGQVSERFNPPLILSLAGSAVLAFFLFHKSTRQKPSNLLLSIFLLTIMVSFLFFPGASFEYYLLGIFPLLLFLPGILIIYFKKLELLIYLMVLLLSVLGVFTVVTNHNVFGFKTKMALVKQVGSIIGNQPFEIKQTGICHAHEAWRYLMVLDGKKPERSDSDKGLGWLYQDEISQKPVKYTVIFSESRVPVNFDVSGAEIISAGGFKAYIFESGYNK